MKPELNPWGRVRRLTLLNLLSAQAAAMVAAVVIAVAFSTESAIAFVIGALVVILPQCWFVLRSARRAGHNQVGALALGKYAISATGFALWFGLYPQAEPMPTLIGAAFAVVAAALTIGFGALRRTGN